MAFITGFFDESYSHSPLPLVYTIAGYISTDVRWLEFQKKWEELLDRELLEDWRNIYGEDKPIFFHMKDFVNQHDKLYGQWSGEKKVFFLKKLHQIIKDHYIKSFATIIVIDDYNALSELERYCLGVPHLCATINCLKRIGEWADKENLTEPILYVFEQGTIHDKDMNWLFNEYSSDEQKAYYRIEKLEFGTKTEALPLQAADILAYETRKEMCRRLDKTITRSVRKSIENLNVLNLDEWFYMDKRHFAEIINHPAFQNGLEDIRQRINR